MSDQEQISQLSALFDGELPSRQSEMVIRRAVKDAAMREHWQRYALIGACLRGEPLAGAGKREDLADRVRAKLAAEADIIAPGALAGRANKGRGGVAGFFGRNAAGGAIAAAVAIVSIVVVRSISPEVADAGSFVASSSSPVEAVAPVLASRSDEGAPRSYTTPGENSPVSTRLVNQQPLAHYVVTHSEQAASALGFGYDLTQGAVETTESATEARR